MTTARVRQEGDQVLLVIDGHGWVMPWQQARELGQALQSKAQGASAFALGHRVLVAPTQVEARHG